MQAIADVFLKPRADNFSSETLFSEFIVPPFFRRLSFFQDKQSVRILGGRGCGKTMFIRYFSHGSALSPHRESVPVSELGAVGLYLRPDTYFCQLMTGEWLGAQQSKLAFSHYVALHLLREACHAVKSINQANFETGPIRPGDPQIGAALRKQLGLASPYTVSELGAILDERLVDFENWVSNPAEAPKPMFISFASAIPRFANDLAGLMPELAGLAFRAFVDEFENLPVLHREVICDAIKHPAPRMVVHIAHKRQAVVDWKTSSDERVVEGHDINTVDLEAQLSTGEEFELLAAELFLLRAHQAKVPFVCPLFKPEFLHDPRHLQYRMLPAYRSQVLKCVRQIFPGPSASEIAEGVLTDAALRKRLRDMIQKGLELQGLSGHVKAESLIDDRSAPASVVLGALLNRKTVDGKTVIEQFKRSVESGGAGDGDPFFKVGGWIDNNLHGCLFHLYAGLPRRPNINYAGFDRYCRMASPNLRFFQALCHTALLLAYERQGSAELTEPLVVDIDAQATAARQVSDRLYEDVLQLGGHGARLLEMTARLGKVFEAYNRRRSQSEPEINHFSIDKADRSSLSGEAELLLREAQIWSVLYEENDTKNKSDYDIAQVDLILNPIYAPHFGISYRKRRKITLQAVHAEVLLSKSTQQFEEVLKQLVDLSETDVEASPGLF